MVCTWIVDGVLQQDNVIIFTPWIGLKGCSLSVDNRLCSDALDWVRGCTKYALLVLYSLALSYTD